MNICIVAGGLQKRFGELSCFPKILLPSKDGTPILMKQIEYFKDQNTISIVVNERFKTIMKAYCAINGLNVDVIVSNNTNGSGNTLASVYNELPKKNVMFFWSDILFDNDDFILDRKVNDEKDNCVIFTTADNKYRYKIEDGKIVNRSFAYDGNVPGIFWIKDISEVIPSKPVEENKDLIDIIQQKVNDGMITFVESKINTKITEYKSLNEYKKIMSTSSQKEIELPNDLHITYDDNEHMQVVAKTNEEKDKLTIQDDWLIILYHTLGCKQYITSLPIEKKEDFWTCDMANLEGYSYARKMNLPQFVNDLSRYNVDVPLSMSVKFLLQEYNGKALDGYLKVQNLLENKRGFDYVQNLVDNGCNLLIDGLSHDKWVLTHGNINSHNIFANMPGSIKAINPVQRYKDTFYCHPIVDKSEAYMTEIGLDDALRKELTYKVDDLPEMPKNTDVFVEAAIYLHLLGILHMFTKDIMKVNIVAEYAINGLSNLINECVNEK